MRINLLGGPGSGKSTTALQQTAFAKIEGYSVEIVTEYVKSWAVANRKVIGFDQIYLMGKQLHYEHRFLSNGIKNIITDSPVILSACYTRMFPGMESVADHMESIVLEYEKQYPSYNIFIERGEKEYKQEGRWQDYEEAVRLDGVIMDTLYRLKIPFVMLPYDEQETIFEFIRENLHK